MAYPEWGVGRRCLQDQPFWRDGKAALKMPRRAVSTTAPTRDPSEPNLGRAAIEY
jgi:hypothetical protein